MSKFDREPSLADLLEDPLTSIIMARDGVKRDWLIALLNSVAKRRCAPAAGQPSFPAAA